MPLSLVWVLPLICCTSHWSSALIQYCTVLLSSTYYFPPLLLLPSWWDNLTPCCMLCSAPHNCWFNPPSRNIYSIYSMQRGRVWHSSGYVVPDSDSSHPVLLGKWEWEETPGTPCGIMAMWQNCHLLMCQCGRIVKWQCGGIAIWQYGNVAERWSETFSWPKIALTISELPISAPYWKGG